jgi:hypothetical protein
MRWPQLQAHDAHSPRTGRSLGVTEVNSFWHGAELSDIERLCISSFLKNGVQYCLYLYERPANLPPGITVKNANEIIDRSRIFTYRAGTFNLGSVAGFSNLFRYTLIHERGGWWTDTDLCYVNGFAEESAEMFFAEPSQGGDFRVATALFKSPAGSAPLRYCLDRFAEKDVTKIVHGETGPSLLTSSILTCAKRAEVLAADTVFPVAWWEYQRLFFDENLSIDNCAAVHFWNAILDSAGVDKNAAYPAKGAFEQLKRKYL